MSNEGSATIPVLIAEGTYYQVGYKVGETFRSQISKALQNDSILKKMRLHYKTPEGSRVYSTMLAAVSRAFPQFVDELRGMADSSGIPLTDLILWNFRFDWCLLLKDQTKGLAKPGCSDVYLANRRGTTLMGHNEDNGTLFVDLGYILQASYKDASSGEPVEEITFYCYPGMLCGNAFGFNSKGVVMTQDALSPSNVNPNEEAIARNFLNRALVGQRLDTMINILDTYRCVSGFSVNLGCLEDLSVINIEVSPTGYQKTCVDGYGYHFNAYLHGNFPQFDGPSSNHRLARIKQLPPPSSKKDILTILGDTGDADYPIYRDATPPDTSVTLCTVFYDLGQKTMEVLVGNPAQEEPVMQFSMAASQR